MYISFICQVNTTILSDASAGRKDQESWFLLTAHDYPRNQERASAQSELPLQVSHTNRLPAVAGRGVGWSSM
jgi:hypothetical protein